MYTTLEVECAELLSLPLVIAQLSEVDVTDQAGVRSTKVHYGLLGATKGMRYRKRYRKRDRKTRTQPERKA